MHRSVVTFFLIMFLYNFNIAQIPVQIFGSNKAIEYNFMWEEGLCKNEMINLFNFTFFNIDYKDPNRNTYEIYQVATYNISKNMGLAGGGRFTNNQFSPQLAISFQMETKDLYINVFPALQYLSNKNQIGYSLFGLLFYRPKINNTWKMFNQVVFEPLFNSQEHIYSYHQIRIGLEYKELFQFGLGINLEHIGTKYATSSNLGIFIRKELI